MRKPVAGLAPLRRSPGSPHNLSRCGLFEAISRFCVLHHCGARLRVRPAVRTTCHGRCACMRVDLCAQNRLRIAHLFATRTAFAKLANSRCATPVHFTGRLCYAQRFQKMLQHLATARLSQPQIALRYPNFRNLGSRHHLAYPLYCGRLWGKVGDDHSHVAGCARERSMAAAKLDGFWAHSLSMAGAPGRKRRNAPPRNKPAQESNSQISTALASFTKPDGRARL